MDFIIHDVAYHPVCRTAIRVEVEEVLRYTEPMFLIESYGRCIGGTDLELHHAVPFHHASATEVGQELCADSLGTDIMVHGQERDRYPASAEPRSNKDSQGSVEEIGGNELSSGPLHQEEIHYVRMEEVIQVVVDQGQYGTRIRGHRLADNTVHLRSTFTIIPNMITSIGMMYWIFSVIIVRSKGKSDVTVYSVLMVQV